VSGSPLPGRPTAQLAAPKSLNLQPVILEVSQPLRWEPESPRGGEQQAQAALLVKGSKTLPPAIPPLDLKAMQALHMSARRTSGKLDSYSLHSSVSAKNAVLTMLKQEEMKNRSIPPGKGKGSSKYKLPVGVACILPELGPGPGLEDGLRDMIGSGTGAKEEELMTPLNVRPQIDIPSSGSFGGGDTPICRQLGQSFDGLCQGPSNNNQEDAEADRMNFSVVVNSFGASGSDSGNHTRTTSDVTKLYRAIPPLPANMKIGIPFVSYSNERISPSFSNFLESLLDIRPEHRLGGSLNYDRLVAHEWFSASKLDWKKVEGKKISPPFTPNKSQIQSELGAKFSSLEYDGSLDMYRNNKSISSDAQERFDDFHHVAPEYFDLFPTLKVHCAGVGSGVKKIRSV
jgi:hypothetical protein